MTFKLPGLVDLHVHFRDPGATQKEDFFTGTSAALAGGYTTVFDMSNNPNDPTVTPEALERKIASAKQQIVCDVGLYFGWFGENFHDFGQVRSKVRGIKLYGLSNTIGDYSIPGDILRSIYRAWDDNDRTIMIHAETDMIKDVMATVAETGQRTHVCHVSCRDELEPILEAKAKGLPVTCGVTPHHLFLTDKDRQRLGNFGAVKPDLKPQADQDFLWEHLAEIDVVESDHAPHTVAEKEAGAFGLPGLETTLPLMLQAEREGRLTRADVLRLCAEGPRRIQRLDDDPTTFVEVTEQEFKISNEGLKTKCGWTPFAGMTGFGRVQRVVLRGKVAFEDGAVVAAPGGGRII